MAWLQVSFQAQRLTDPNVGTPAPLQQQPAGKIERLPPGPADKLVQVLEAAGELRIRCAPARSPAEHLSRRPSARSVTNL